MNRLVDMKQIAAALNCHPQTVMLWASLPRDPLPLYQTGAAVWSRPHFLEDWAKRRAELKAWLARRPRGIPLLPIFPGWEKIASIAEVSVDTAQRWASLPEDPLPVIGVEERTQRLLRVGRQDVVWIFQSATRDWLTRHTIAYRTGTTRPRPKPQKASCNEIEVQP